MDGRNFKRASARVVNWKMNYEVGLVIIQLPIYAAKNSPSEQFDAEDKVQELTKKFNANQASLEVLRSERDALTEHHAELQQKFTQVTKVCHSHHLHLTFC